MSKDSHGGKLDTPNRDVQNVSSYGNSAKSGVDVLKASDYGNSDKSDVDVPKASRYRKTDNFNRDVQNERNCQNIDELSKSVSTQVKTVDLQRFENGNTENLEVKLAEVQNLDFKEWEDYQEERDYTETYFDNYEYFTELGLQEEKTFAFSKDFSKSAEQVEIANCEHSLYYRMNNETIGIQEQTLKMDSEFPFSCETKAQEDDALSESEIAFLRQLGIENPQEIAHETISVHGQEKETDFTYPLYDIPYGNSEMEYSATQNLTVHEYMQEITDNFAMESLEVQDLGFKHFRSCRSSEIELQEVQNLDFKKLERQTCRSSEVELQEVQELNPNYTNNNYTNKSYTEMSYNNLIYPIYQSDKRADGCDGLDESSAYISLIKENIDYDYLMQDKKWNDRELYEELFQLICEIVCVKRESVRVAGEDYPYELVKSKFLKLNSSHLTYVMDCMQKTVSKIGNIKAYMITALYNAGSTINHYYRQAVQHDMYGGGWQEAGII